MMMSPSKETEEAIAAVREEWPEIAARAGALLGATMNGADPGYCHRCNIHPAEVCGYCEGTSEPRMATPPQLEIIGGDAPAPRELVESTAELETLVGRLEDRVAELVAGGLKGGACFICAREALSGLTFKFKPVCLSCA